MKKLLAIVLAMMVMLSLVACGEDSDGKGAENTDAPSQSNAAGNDISDPSEKPESDDNGAGDENNSETEGEDSSEGADDETASPDNTEENAQSGNATAAPDDTTQGDENDSKSEIKAVIKHTPKKELEFIYVPTDADSGVLKVADVNIADEKDLAGLGFKAPMALKDIAIYNVTFVKSADGVCVVEGTISGATSKIEGESAAEYLEMFKQKVDTSSETNKLMYRVISGEVLTEKAEIEKYTYEINSTIRLSFTEEKGVMTVKEYSKSYTEFGSQRNVKESYEIKDAVIRGINEYEDEKLEMRCEFRADGTKEKEIYYDENGDIYSSHDCDAEGNIISKEENSTDIGGSEKDEFVSGDAAN